jgi:hypothetical protein
MPSKYELGSQQIAPSLRQKCDQLRLGVPGLKVAMGELGPN